MPVTRPKDCKQRTQVARKGYLSTVAPQRATGFRPLRGRGEEHLQSAAVCLSKTAQCARAIQPGQPRQGLHLKARGLPQVPLSAWDLHGPGICSVSCRQYSGRLEILWLPPKPGGVTYSTQSLNQKCGFLNCHSLSLTALPCLTCHPNWDLFYLFFSSVCLHLHSQSPSPGPIISYREDSVSTSSSPCSTLPTSVHSSHCHWRAHCKAILSPYHSPASNLPDSSLPLKENLKSLLQHKVLILPICVRGPQDHPWVW